VGHGAVTFGVHVEANGVHDGFAGGGHPIRFEPLLAEQSVNRTCGGGRLPETRPFGSDQKSFSTVCKYNVRGAMRASSRLASTGIRSTLSPYFW